jgi:hypothetical protein
MQVQTISDSNPRRQRIAFLVIDRSRLAVELTAIIDVVVVVVVNNLG